MMERFPLPSKNAMTPILWAVGIMAATVIPASVWLPTWAAIIGWILLSSIVLMALWAYQFFVRNDPNQLRSEDHSLKLEALHLHNRAPGSGDQIANILSAQPVMSGQFLEDKKGRKNV